MFDAADPPLRVRPRWVTLPHGGTTRVFMVHGQCCLTFRAPDHGYCTSCPYTTDAERDTRWRRRLDEQAAR